MSLLGALSTTSRTKFVGRLRYRGYEALKLVQLHGVWKLPEQEEIHRLFKTIPFFFKGAPDKIFNIYSAVIELTLTGDLFTVDNLLGNDIRYLR